MRRRAWIYLFWVLLAGAVAAGLALAELTTVTIQRHWLIFTILTSTATIAQLYRADSPDHHLYYVTLVFFFAGSILLPPPLLVLLILVPHLAEWAVERARGSSSLVDWYLQPFNISTHIICALLAQRFEGGVIVSSSHPTVAMAVNSLLAAILYVALNHFLVGLALLLARGLSWRNSGILEIENIQADLIMLLIGLTFAVLWNVNQLLVIPALLPLLLIYRVLKIPGLIRQTQIDPKTGLFNATYFNNCFADELERARRFDRPLTLALCNLDLLRDINDAFSHVAGDVVLESVAHILRDAAREYDAVARFSSDEFAILLPETPVDQAYLRLEALRQVIEATEHTVPSSVFPVKATVSFGIAGRSEEDVAVDELMRQAEQALYVAKRRGRNRVIVYQGDRREREEGPTEERVSVPVFSMEDHARTLSAAIAKKTGADGHVDQQDIDAAYKVSSDGDLREYPSWSVPALVIGVAVSAIMMAAALLGADSNGNVDSSGLAVFVFVALLAELLALEVYHGDTTVSTSVAPLLGGALLFGPLGAVALGITVAVASWIRHRTPAKHFLFNASNHVIGGLFATTLVVASGRPIGSWSLPVQEALSLGAVTLIYFTSTILLAAAVGMRRGRSIRSVWIERFRWMAPYYLGLGVVAHALIFSYISAGMVGVLAILVPLLILRYSQKQYLDHTRHMVTQLRRTNSTLAGQAAEITLLNEELLLTLARSIDLRDPYVLEHSKNVSRYAALTATELGLSPQRVEQIRKAGLLHDIGKLGVPEAILFKPDRLADDEYLTVCEHVEVGATLMRGCHTLRVLIPFVKHHHERYDGSGYPDQLAGEAIPLEARILGLADAVEAMASDRPYKKALTSEDILREINACAGKQFDPAVAKAFERVVTREGPDVIVNSAREVELRHRNPDNGRVRFSERG